MRTPSRDEEKLHLIGFRFRFISEKFNEIHPKLDISDSPP